MLRCAIGLGCCTSFEKLRSVSKAGGQHGIGIDAKVGKDQTTPTMNMHTMADACLVDEG